MTYRIPFYQLDMLLAWLCFLINRIGLPATKIQGDNAINRNNMAYFASSPGITLIAHSHGSLMLSQQPETWLEKMDLNSYLNSVTEAPI